MFQNFFNKKFIDFKKDIDQKMLNYKMVLISNIIADLKQNDFWPKKTIAYNFCDL